MLIVMTIVFKNMTIHRLAPTTGTESTLPDNILRRMSDKEEKVERRKEGRKER